MVTTIGGLPVGSLWVSLTAVEKYARETRGELDATEVVLCTNCALIRPLRTLPCR